MTKKFAPPPTKYGHTAPMQAKADKPSMVYLPPPTKFGQIGAARSPLSSGTPGPVVQRSIGPYDKRADDEIGLRLSTVPSPMGTPAGKLNAFRMKFKGHENRAHFKASRKNIEAQSLKVHRKIVKGGVKKPGALKAKETEIIGELAALHVAMTWPSMLGYEMVMPSDPGHGRGIDQFWRKGPAANPTEYLIVEAKGPDAKLSTITGQMSKAWVTSRLQQLANGSAPADVKAHAANALNAINGGAPPRVRGMVLTARWDLTKTKLTATKSNDVYYN